MNEPYSRSTFASAREARIYGLIVSVSSPHSNVSRQKCAHAHARYGECANIVIHQLSRWHGDMMPRVNIDSGRRPEAPFRSC
jgi:hypothetical protein